MADPDAALRERIQTTLKNAARLAIEAGRDHDKRLYRAAVEVEALADATLAVLELKQRADELWRRVDENEYDAGRRSALEDAVDEIARQLGVRGEA